MRIYLFMTFIRVLLKSSSLCVAFQLIVNHGLESNPQTTRVLHIRLYKVYWSQVPLAHVLFTLLDLFISHRPCLFLVQLFLPVVINKRGLPFSFLTCQDDGNYWIAGFMQPIARLQNIHFVQCLP